MGIKYFLLIFIFIETSFAQNNNFIGGQDSLNTMSNELSKLYSYIKNYKSKIDIVADMDTISDARLKKIAKNMYEIREKDPVVAESILYDECKLSDSLAKQQYEYKRDVKIFAKPTLSFNYIYKKIEEVLPHNVYPLIKADYLLRIKILQMETVPKEYFNYKTGRSEPPMSSTEIEAKIIEIIKGENRFTIGQKIKFYFMPFWIPGNPFIENEECFVLLQVRLDPDFHLNQIGLLATLSSNYGRYHIENNIINDKENYFGYGTTLPWRTFKDNLLGIIKAIKSW